MKKFSKLLTDRNQALYNIGFEFFCNYLNITEEEKTKLEIKLKKRLRKASGNCNGHYYAPTNHLLRVYINVVDYGSTLGMLEVLAHELVHAKQHFRGDFHFVKKQERFLFFFKTWRWQLWYKDQCLEDTPYYEQECEQEAFNESYTMMLQFADYINKQQIRMTDDKKEQQLLEE